MEPEEMTAEGLRAWLGSVTTMESKYILLNPALARELLATNSNNRTLRAGHLGSLVSDMGRGAWKSNPAPIQVSEESVLLDGQHRLEAISRSGVSLPMVVAAGVPADVMSTLDTNARRTFADALKLRGEADYVALASITVRARRWLDGARGDALARGRFRKDTYSELLVTLEENHDLRVAAAATRRWKSSPLIRSASGFGFWLFSRLPDESAAEDALHFFDRVSDGVDLGAESPIRILRERVSSDRLAKGTTLDEAAVLAFTIKAWNAYRRGEQITLLRWKPGGVNPEKFPEPV